MNERNIFFPQWQASGKTPDVYHGAYQLLEHLQRTSPSMDWEHIPVDATAISSDDHGIIGYQSVLDNLSAAQVVLNNQPNDDFLFTLGGDCGIEVAPIAALNERLEGDLTVLWMDGHGDLNTPESSPSGTFHGMPLRALLGEGDPTIVAKVPRPLRPDQVILVGVRDLDVPEAAYIIDNQVQLLTIDDLRTDVNALNQAIQSKSSHHVYLHVDMDVIDPTEFASAFYPAPNGLKFAELFALIAHIHTEFKVVGACVTECKIMSQPDLDQVAQLINRLHLKN